MEVSTNFSWVVVLPFVKVAINSAKSDTTHSEPFELVFGCLLAALIDRLPGLGAFAAG